MSENYEVNTTKKTPDFILEITRISSFLSLLNECYDNIIQKFNQLELVMLNPFGSFQSRYKDFKEKWHNKTPKEKWQSVYNFSKMTCEIIGIRVLSDIKNYWYTISCGLDGILYFVLVTYTVQYYFRRGEYIRSMECTCLIGIVVLVSFCINFEILCTYINKFP